MRKPVLYIVVPCYNEELVLPISSRMLLERLMDMIGKNLIHADSRILFVDDGSGDRTWSILEELARRDSHCLGIQQSRNRGHQNAVLAGLMEAMERCDITISIDCDGQDDMDAMEEMVRAYLEGSEIVYGVRSRRDTDSGFKRVTAQAYYTLMCRLGVDVVFNHSDYRLVSRRVLQVLAEYEEVNLYLRGLFPLIGFKSTCVPYERKSRIAGKSKYSLKRMAALAIEGITGLSLRPIRMVFWLGLLTMLTGGAGLLWTGLGKGAGDMSMTHWLIVFMGGIQLLSTGVIGEYIGKIHQEVKGRPRYIISKRTEEKQ